MTPPFGAMDHESRLLQFFNVLLQGDSFVGALPHEIRIFQYFIVPEAKQLLPTLGRRPSKVRSSACMTDFSFEGSSEPEEN